MDKKPTIICLCNNKGGVAKTTTAAALGQALSLYHKKKVLLVDIDAQGNLSQTFGISEGGEDMFSSLKKGLSGLRIESIENRLSIVPSSSGLLGIEKQNIPMNTFSALKEKKDFDYIVIDCPPAMETLTISAISAANVVIIPLPAEALPLQGLKVMQELVEKVRSNINPDLKMRILITRWKSNRKVCEIIEQKIREIYKESVFSTKIRDNITVAESTFDRQGLFHYAPKCNGAEDYKALTKEFLKMKI